MAKVSRKSKYDGPSLMVSRKSVNGSRLHSILEVVRQTL